jgi:hypothetical protein
MRGPHDLCEVDADGYVCGYADPRDDREPELPPPEGWPTPDDLPPDF